MRCYLINLDRSDDRLLRMTAEFERIGLEFTRVPAVDGRSFAPERLYELMSEQRPWAAPLTASEIGCFLSHKRCLELIAVGADEYAAIFEDDVIFAQDARMLLNSDGWIPEDADVVKIETHRKKVLTDQPISCRDSRFSVARLCSGHILAAGYVVSRDAAQRLLDEMKIISVPIDHLLFNPSHGVFSKLVIYQLLPALCIQSGVVSTIEAERQGSYERPPLGSRIVRELKRIVRRTGSGAVGLWINCATKRRWGRVPFS
ncbi:glycosyltransferase family 25 protein [Aquamicrobium sp. LC103]|uniref:glycosyltransferase family 25 protein n=1 Tax=Aquamicrobium sp. LC103 TaxID=1120658 RepID=UPI0009E600D6|nr:glycosyltransferase family 25 protein [Aquamicrobium sp. LC103]TKT79235.1 glycosyltransferase family 25 protein [Aquamicrobium sp. LC103]